MKKIMCALVVMFALSMVSGTGITLALDKKQGKTYPDVKTITKEELAQKLARNEPIQIVNVLSPDYYKLGIIKGSKKIPLDQLDGRIHELDKTQEVVTYCANYMCTASREAARDLAKKGFKVRAYEGGIEEWTKSGLPLETQGSSKK